MNTSSSIAISGNQSKTMSSLEIAELTGKQHKEVLRDIRNILDQAEISSAQFCSVYKDQQLIERPCFKLPRRECDLVIAGYSVKYRLAIIDRWQELESTAQLKLPQTYVEALRALADESEAKQKALEQLSAAEQQIEADKPKVDFAMAVRNLDGSCMIGELAKVLGYGRTTFFSMLRNDMYLMANNQPYQRYIDSGYFVLIENIPFVDRDGKSHPSFTTRVTGKGQVVLEKKYRKHNDNPIPSVKNGLVGYLG